MTASLLTFGALGIETAPAAAAHCEPGTTSGQIDCHTDKTCVKGACIADIRVCSTADGCS